MLKYRKINNELLRVGRTAIAPPPLKEVREQAQRSMCIEGGMLITPYFDKKHNNPIIRN